MVIYIFITNRRRHNRLQGDWSSDVCSSDLAAIVREMANFDGKETLECIPTSFQIKLEAQCSGLKLVGEDRMPEVDVVFEIGRASCRERGQICVREFRCITQQL